ncbi:TPA: RHS repeat protein, partial [Enterobacter kobei]|nr:RHS repeat protein [Enterobacter kobei]
MPRQTEFSVPVYVTRYTYTTLGDGANVAQESVAHYADDVLLQKRNYAYITTLGPEYGRIITITDTKYEDGETSASFITTQAFTTDINGGIMHQTTTFTGHDGLTAIFVRQQSAFSGLLLRETNAQDVSTTYTYDKMGRLRTRTVAPDTEYENTATWTYSIDQGSPLTTITDAVGNQTRLRLDGAGRTVGLQRLDSDNMQQWYDVATARYDAFGDTRTGSCYDWLTSTIPPESYHLEANTTFDPWGTPNLQIFSDGTRNRQDIDPVALIRSAYMQGYNGGSLQDSGTVTTTFDAVSQLPVTEQRTNTAGQVQGTVQYAWDGLGQLREETDERGYVTEHTYDAFGRALTRTLPDGSILTRTYAPHLSGEQVTSISVTGPDAQGQIRTWLLGTQTFDGLGRLTRQESGGRISQYGYTGASPVSDDVLLPSGKHIQLTFIPELGNVVSSVTAEGVLQTFSYDSTTADLLTAQEGGTENRNTWTSSGNLKEETFIADGGLRKALHTWTLAGSPVVYTDITDRQTV